MVCISCVVYSSHKNSSHHQLTCFTGKTCRSKLNQQRFQFIQGRPQLWPPICRLLLCVMKTFWVNGGGAAWSFHRLSVLDIFLHHKIKILRSFRNDNHLCWRDQNMKAYVLRHKGKTLEPAWKLVWNRFCQKNIFSQSVLIFLILSIISPFMMLTWKYQKWALQIGKN